MGPQLKKHLLHVVLNSYIGGLMKTPVFAPNIPIILIEYNNNPQSNSYHGSHHFDDLQHYLVFLYLNLDAMIVKLHI